MSMKRMLLTQRGLKIDFLGKTNYSFVVTKLNKNKILILNIRKTPIYNK